MKILALILKYQKYLLWIVGTSLFINVNLIYGNPDFIDYEKLTQNIEIETLRSGNNDPEGINEYYFQPTLIALLNSKEERKKEINKRTKSFHQGEIFGAVTIKTLSSMNKDMELSFGTIEGDKIRELISGMMSSYKFEEQNISLYVEIKMYEKNKKYLFFGEDQLVGSTTYFILSDDVNRKPLTETHYPKITDNFGTYVQFKVLYPSKKKTQ